jgi:hypothetical protein
MAIGPECPSRRARVLEDPPLSSGNVLIYEDAHQLEVGDLDRRDLLLGHAGGVVERGQALWEKGRNRAAKFALVLRRNERLPKYFRRSP